MAIFFLPTTNTSHTILLSTPKEPPPKYSRRIKATAAPVQLKSKKLTMQSLEKAFLSQTILSYAKSGRMEEARQLFDSAKNPDLFLWNTMIRGYTYAKFYEEVIALYHNMFSAGLKANSFTFPFVIKSCTYLAATKEGLKVHARLFKCGLDSNFFIGNSLIKMYSAFGLIDDAQKVFDEMPAKDLVSWNSMIDGYALNREGRKALSCFKDLPGSLGKQHDGFGIMSALGACSLEASLKSGREIHGYMIRNDLEKDTKVVTSLLDMYCKCKDMSSAEKVFNRIPIKTVVTWNSLIGGYSLNEQYASAISCVKKMLCENTEPDTVTMVKLIAACAAMENASVGKTIHAYSMRKGFLPHMYIETALTDLYGKCGELRSAQLLFDRMLEKNLVSWNAMLAAYVKNQEYRKAIDLFVGLLNDSVEPDLYTTCAIVPAFTELASLKDGKQIHSYAVRKGFSNNLVLSNSIIYMYAKCGDLKSSREVFDRISHRDLISWNTILLGYGIHGHGKAALDLFSDMKAKGYGPDELTFLSLLTACSVSGVTDEGWVLFKSMQKDYGLVPQTEHYVCMVDLIGRTGDFDETLRFIDEMPLAPSAAIWGSLLRASRNSNNIEVAEMAAERISEIQHDNTGCYVTLCNMYADAGRWDDVSRVRDLMSEKGLRKTDAVSLVELPTKQYSFVNSDMSHAESLVINEASDKLSTLIGMNLHKPDDVFDPIHIGEVMTNRHSVRLAVVFGLISSRIGSPVLVKKNVRICDDCHDALKKISKFTCREIVIGDSSIYHHFCEGSCSCGDYW
ncbi:hypothetical protein LUZ61_018938 [Rhynchospora tenuis]|uniref:DYW domain-containing protein n=1 Tax=Rhynchospora tenuis TaxID=198213 RepID=A0AAD5ZAE3_9POAL|nr:hypothetical protein LUZ61_018938 [Rhynchospora tenuis]